MNIEDRREQDKVLGELFDKVDQQKEMFRKVMDSEYYRGYERAMIDMANRERKAS